MKAFNFQSQLPVRRLSHPSPARTWDLVRQELETYSLVFPSVAFILEDINHAQNFSHRKERVVRIPKVRAKNASFYFHAQFISLPYIQSDSTLNRFRHLFGHALTEVFGNCAERSFHGLFAYSTSKKSTHRWIP